MIETLASAVGVGVFHAVLVAGVLRRYDYPLRLTPGLLVHVVAGMTFVATLPAFLLLEFGIFVPTIVFLTLFVMVLLAERAPTEGEPLGAIYVRGWPLLLLLFGSFSLVETAVRVLFS